MWSHNRLFIVKQGPQPVVVLGRPTGQTDQEKTRNVQKGLLARELVRQAILVAARDELGLATRDELLGDSVSDAGDASADVASLARLNGPASLRIERDGGVVLERELHPPAPLHDLMELTKSVEALSRSELPKALKSLGVDGKPNVVRQNGDVTASVKEKLDNIGMVGPLAAVREIHASIRAEGESPARMGALVRGYTHLGVLNEYLWTPAHKAFKARALLYAQRLLSRNPRSAWALWHRAYVEAMIGLHQRALDDIAEAESTSKSEANLEKPAWVDTITTYCHFDLNRLKNIEGSQAKLASLLRLLALEFPNHSDVPLHEAKRILAMEPECFRAHEVMYRVGGVSNLHVATQVAPEVLTKIVPEKLRELATLPASVRDAIDHKARETRIMDALESAGKPGVDSGEPSWSVLGAMIRETWFVHIQHRLDFLTRWLSVPATDEWAAARPLISRHPFVPYLEALANPAPQADQAFAAAFPESWFADLEYAEEPMISRLAQGSPAKFKPAWNFAQLHMDHLVRDFSLQCDLYTKTSGTVWAHNAEKILGLSPENPFAMSLVIETDFEKAKPHLAEWAKKGLDYPRILGSLGRRYSEVKEYDKANELLESYIKESPEHWAFERLAKNYKEQGDDARWLEILNRYLSEGEDHGLEHAKVQVEIADYYMDQRQFAKARPFADDAAQTGAGWAMLCVGRCYEGLKEWKRAEAWYQLLSQRYPSSSIGAWLKFCKRTGHGDLKSAQQLVDLYNARVATLLKSQPQPTDPLDAGYSAWLSGAKAEAVEHFRKAYQSSAPIMSGLSLMAIADEEGDAQQRDGILKEMAAKYAARSPKLFNVLKLFSDAFAKGDRAVPESGALEAALQDVAINMRGNTEFYVGWFLRKRGNSGDAEKYFRRSVETTTTYVWVKQLANAALLGQ